MRLLGLMSEFISSVILSEPTVVIYSQVSCTLPVHFVSNLFPTLPAHMGKKINIKVLKAFGFTSYEIFSKKLDGVEL
jgi:hypothetical protein